jgi:hypothetical protein
MIRMTMRNALAATTAIILLGACAVPSKPPESGEAAGTESEPGAITPLEAPVVVRHAPLTGANGRGRYEVRRFDGRQQMMDMRWQLGVAVRDGQRRWDFRITDAVVDARRASSKDPPLIEYQALTSGRGTVEEASIAFPYYASRGAKDIPTVGSEAYATFARTLRHFVVPVPSAGFKTGDLLLTPEQNAQWLDAYLRLDARSDAQQPVRSNSLRSEVVGTLWEEGRQKIVARHLGSAEAGDAQAGVAVSQSGYVVVDVLTGLVTAQVLQIELTRSIDGKRSSAVALIRSTQAL